MKWIDDALEYLELGADLVEKAAEFLDRRTPQTREERTTAVDSRVVVPASSASRVADAGERPTRLQAFLWRNLGWALIFGYAAFAVAFFLCSRWCAIGLAYAAILGINVSILREDTAYHGLYDAAFRLFCWILMSFVYLGMFITPVWFVDGVARWLFQ